MSERPLGCPSNVTLMLRNRPWFKWFPTDVRRYLNLRFTSATFCVKVRIHIRIIDKLSIRIYLHFSVCGVNSPVPQSVQRCSFHNLLKFFSEFLANNTKLLVKRNFDISKLSH